MKHTPMSAKGTLEVHEHHYISGPFNGQKLRHSHADGSQAHSHQDTGPASFTIDKDEWYWTTGLRGGGRKRYTVRPIGLQLPLFFD